MIDSSSGDDNSRDIEYSELTLASGATALGSVMGSDLRFIKLTHSQFPLDIKGLRRTSRPGYTDHAGYDFTESLYSGFTLFTK
jgi:hypothetical protein